MNVPLKFTYLKQVLRIIAIYFILAEASQLKRHIKVHNKPVASDGVLEWIGEDNITNDINLITNNNERHSSKELSVLAGGLDLQTAADTSRLFFEVSNNKTSESPKVKHYIRSLIPLKMYLSMCHSTTF